MASTPNFAVSSKQAKTTITIKDDTGTSFTFYRHLFDCTAEPIAEWVATLMRENSPAFQSEEMANVFKPRKPRDSGDEEDNS